MMTADAPTSVAVTPAIAAFEPLLDRFAVAKALSIAPITLARWVRDGIFPPPLAFTFGCKKWEESTVRAWIDQKRREAGR